MTVNDPVLVFDDECGVCTDSAKWLQDNGPITPLGFTDVSPEIEDQLPGDWQSCAHLITDNHVYSCGAAMEEAFLQSNHWLRNIVLWLRLFPGYGFIRESVYRHFAQNRNRYGSVIRKLSFPSRFLR